jgi:hypothetical protein
MEPVSIESFNPIQADVGLQEDLVSKVCFIEQIHGDFDMAQSQGNLRHGHAGLLIYFDNFTDRWLQVGLVESGGHQIAVGQGLRIEGQTMCQPDVRNGGAKSMAVERGTRKTVGGRLFGIPEPVLLQFVAEG